MLDLFETPWDRLTLAALAAWLEDAGEEGVTWEAKADDEKGRLHIDSVRKAACGLANQIGGYILIGARWDRKTRTWSLPGVTPPDLELETWIGKAMRGLQPVPRYAPKSWSLDDGRVVAVVWVEPVDLPPCMTSHGRIYERVSRETLPVQDPALLDRLQRRGDAARGRAEQFADRAARRALDFIEWADGRAVGIALAIAPIGRETDDIGARLFVPSFREAIVAATWSFWGNGQPQGIDPRQEQDAFTVAGHFEQGYDLASGGAATRRHRSSWLLQATWDGAIAAAAHFSPDALIGNATVETRAPDGDDLGSVQRELQRAAGIESYEAEPSPPRTED